MLVIVYGTTGELIKLLPLIKNIDRNDYLTICTYQQPQQLKQLWQSTGLPEPDFKIGRSETAPDLEKISSIPFWLLQVISGFVAKRRAIKKRMSQDSQRDIVIVHGDTLTTVAGTLMGRLLGVKVAHIEAGLRSYNWRHPFPEEIDRILTSKLAHIHFAPGQTPVENLKKAGAKGEVINTRYNTVLDSLRLAKKTKISLDLPLPEAYGVVSIHRNELLAQSPELKNLLESLETLSKRLPLIFLDHPVTKERIHSLGFDQLLKNPRITRVPKMPYFKFISLVAQSDCVISDSGGLQEECAYLGIPCLIHRKATERQEGLGQNVVLSMYEHSKVDEFMRNYHTYRTTEVPGAIKPTEIIINYLKKKNYL